MFQLIAAGPSDVIPDELRTQITDLRTLIQVGDQAPVVAKCDEIETSLGHLDQVYADCLTNAEEVLTVCQK